jgi:hypothetical protein
MHSEDFQPVASFTYPPPWKYQIIYLQVKTDTRLDLFEVWRLRPTELGGSWLYNLLATRTHPKMASKTHRYYKTTQYAKDVKKWR